jgi:carbonic anhydrase
MEEILFALLDGNRDHVASLRDGYFDAVQDTQWPPVVSICCSDSRVSQEGMWDVDEPGWLFTPSNIGNQAWDDHDGDLVVDGNLLYPLANTDTKTVAVVGHTGCGAVTAAYGAATGDGVEHAPGIAKYVDQLVPVVEDGLDSDVVDADADDTDVVNQLVEYNVDRQVAFLQDADAVPDDVDIHGFVYDFQEVYGDAYGRTYLVNRDGQTDPEAIAASLPEAYSDQIDSLLY